MNIGDTVTTVEDLDALPTGSVILIGSGFPVPKTSEGWEFDNCCGRHVDSGELWDNFISHGQQTESTKVLHVPDLRDERTERLVNAVTKLARWAGYDHSELIEDGLLEEGDLDQ